MLAPNYVAEKKKKKLQMTFGKSLFGYKENTFSKFH